MMSLVSDDEGSRAGLKMLERDFWCICCGGLGVAMEDCADDSAGKKAFDTRQSQSFAWD